MSSSLFNLSVGRGLFKLININLSNQIRTNVRWRFEKISEVKRWRQQSYSQRIKTKTGRNIIMRRLLRNRIVLSPP